MNNPSGTSRSADVFGSFTKKELDQDNGNGNKACYQGRNIVKYDSASLLVEGAGENQVLQITGDGNTVFMNSNIQDLTVSGTTKSVPVFEYNVNTENWSDYPYMTQSISLKSESLKLRKTLCLLAINCQKYEGGGDKLDTIKAVLHNKIPGKRISKMQPDDLSSFLLKLDFLVVENQALTLSSLYDLLRGNGIDSLAEIIKDVAMEPDGKLSLPEKYPSLNKVLKEDLETSFYDINIKQPVEFGLFRRHFGLINDEALISMLSYIYMQPGDRDDDGIIAFTVLNIMTYRGQPIRKLIEVLYYFDKQETLVKLEELMKLMKLMV